MTCFAKKYKGLYTKEIDYLIEEMKKTDEKIKVIQTLLKVESTKDLLEEYYLLTSKNMERWDEIQKKANEVD